MHTELHYEHKATLCTQSYIMHTKLHSASWSGDVTISKPQPTIALMMACALAKHARPLTKQNVKHLCRFIKALAHCQTASNAMFRAIDS